MTDLRIPDSSRDPRGHVATRSNPTTKLLEADRDGSLLAVWREAVRTSALFVFELPTVPSVGRAG